MRCAKSAFIAVCLAWWLALALHAPNAQADSRVSGNFCGQILNFEANGFPGGDPCWLGVSQPLLVQNCAPRLSLKYPPRRWGMIFFNQQPALCSVTALIDLPLEQSTSWHFRYRTALHPRAPDGV